MKKVSVLLLTIMLLLTSCSRLDLAVNLANTYVTNKADDFFDLTREQSKWLKASLSNEIARIKKTIFPQLAAEMFSIADILNTHRTFDSSTVLTSYNRLEGLFYETMRMVAPTAMVFSDKLTPNQINYFQKEADKKFAEMKEDPDKKSYTKIKKQFDSWAGGMDSNQKKDLKVFVDKNPPPVKESVYNRQSLVHEFVRSSSDPVTRRKFVEKLFTNYDSLMDTGYKKSVEEKHKKVALFVTNILNKMPDNQKQTLIETIRDRANQLIKISRG